MKSRRILSTAIISSAILLTAAQHAKAANFTLSSNSTTAQTLGSGAGQVGTVNAGVSLTVSGGTVAVTITGNNATLTNLGTISQTGTGRVIRDNTGVTGLVVNNGSITNSAALMQAADADVIQMNVANGAVTLNNYGSMISLNTPTIGGNQAVDFSAITTGANSVNNFATGLMQAAEADAVRPGVNGVVNNAGTMKATTTTGSSSDGVDAQNNTGVIITNASNAGAGTGTGLIEGARHGITGAALNNTVSFTTNVTNNLGGIIKGNNGSGINFDGFNALQTATVVNHGTITGNGVAGDGDGIDSDGLINLTNTGIIRSINAFSAVVGAPAQSEGISVGGGIIINSGTIEGLVAAGNTNAVGRGISLLGNDITTGPLAGTREAIYGNATVTNQAGGMIRGDSDSGIAVGGPASGFTVTINNNAGATIQGGGATNAAILTGADNDTINNAGTINGSSSGKAISMGAGNNTLTITGGTASVLGDIDGGSGGTNVMTINPGIGNSFSYSGSISNFNAVEAKSGTITLSGVNAYTGITKITGGTLTLDGANRIAAASALDMNGGTLALLNASGANAQTFASFSLHDDSTFDLNSATSLTFNGLGTFLAGKTLAVLDYSSTASPYYAVRFAGDYSLDASFLSLIGETTINGLDATFFYDGAFTDVVPVPEPATFVVGLALMGVAFGRRRRGTAALA